MISAENNSHFKSVVARFSSLCESFKLAAVIINHAISGFNLTVIAGRRSGKVSIR